MAIAAGVLIVRVYLPFTMATSRNRNGYLWILIGVILGAVLTIILLLLLGEKQDVETIQGRHQVQHGNWNHT